MGYIMSHTKDNEDTRSEIAKKLRDSNIAARAARDTRKFESGDVYVAHDVLDKKVEKILNDYRKSGHKADKDFFDYKDESLNDGTPLAGDVDHTGD